MNLRNFFNNIYRYIYLVIFIVFLIWMIFLDTHSLKIHNELDREVEKLEIQKKELEKLIKEDEKNIKYLKNTDSLERFAREKYGHKKENETIFYIEYKDSIQQ